MVLALGAGVAIAAAAGLRAFLPLLALGLAARFGIVELHHSVRWLAQDHALWAFGAATVIEIAADKIPIVDHALDAVGVALKPMAAALGAYAALVHWPTPWGQIVALVLAGGALAIHLAKAKLRLGSTALSMGTANPVLSTIEDGVSLLVLAAGLLVPLLAMVVVVIGVVWMVRRSRRREAMVTS
jgi:uncharacterized protein DUF4126